MKKYKKTIIVALVSGIILLAFFFFLSIKINYVSEDKNAGRTTSCTVDIQLKTDLHVEKKKDK